MSLALGALAVGCGDNNKACGPGTVDKDGYCTSTGATCGSGTKMSSDGTCVADGSVVCSDGTILNSTMDGCVIDPNSCQGDTVLIGNKCVDPTAGLTVDVEEGAEPNGFGILGEPSQNPAGIVSLKAVGGDPEVVHGTIVPADHDGDGIVDNDVDTYGLQVAGPTLVEVSVDGVHGLTGGFLSVSGVNALGNFQRIGVNLTGDTAKRQVFLPAAGIYGFAIADSRAILSVQKTDGFGPGLVAGADPGKPAFEYYMSLTNLALPTPTALTFTNGVAHAPAGSTFDGTVQFYTAPLGTGLNIASERIDSPNANAALVVMKNNTFATDAEGSADTLGFFGNPIGTATAIVGGFAAADTALFAIDAQYHFDSLTPTYDFRISSSTGTALSKTGGTATQAETTDNPQSLADLNMFFFDVDAADDTLGFAMSFNNPLDATIIDSTGHTVANFTFSGGQPSGDTFAAYNGLMRFPAAGRYYLIGYDPANAGTGNIVVTSKIATLATAAVTLDTPLTGQAVDDSYDSLSFSYASTRATNPWQVFTTTSTGSAAVTVDFYDPSSAYGRLDPVTTANNGATTPDDLAAVFSTNQAATGRILLDDPSDNYYVHVRPNTTTGARNVTLNFAKRVFHDYGTVAGGAATITLAGETTTVNPAKFYLVKTTAGNRATITATPTDTPTTASEDLTIATLNNVETAVVTTNATTLGGTEVASIQSTPRSGWVAFEVTASLGANHTYTLDLNVKNPVAYTTAAGTTTYADACMGGGTVVDTFDPAGDEGVSDQINAPTGFKLFGAPVTSFNVSTNGFLSFDNAPAGQPDSEFQNLSLPDSSDVSNGTVAAYWDDLVGVVVCQKTIGTKLVIQWKGTICNFSNYTRQCQDGVTAVRAQAILNGADSSIEFVYGPGQVADGSSATVGIEDLQSVVGDQLSFETAASVTASSSKKITPGP